MIHRLSSTSAISCTVAVLLVGLLIAPVQAQEQTPTQTFNAYRKALATATAYSELLPFMESKGRAMIESMPTSAQAKMFELLKKFAGTYSDVVVTRETVTGNTAVLDLSGKDPKGQAATGSVPMTKEASGWKVGTEKWSSKPGSPDNAQPRVSSS
jgi:flagellar biosynthesis protein FliQ